MKNLLVITLLTVITSCSVEPKEINYGTDKCDYCTMTIVDKPYGTELVTDKGKVYKFDSVECLLNYINEGNSEYSYVLTNTMDKPGELIDAKTSYYLVSENLPSPMGANITAFTTQDLAKQAQAEYQGEVYNYNILIDYYKNSENPHNH